MANNDKKGWESAFDERFELESEGCSECGGFELIDKKEIRYPKGKYHCEYDLEKIKDFIRAEREAVEASAYERGRNEDITENTSDGYHTFKELYEFRKVYNALLFNEWSKQGKYQVHKSMLHSDGQPCFGGGWFIVMATLPTGQISNHYELKDWNLFNCEERDKADEWDGHTPQDVLARMYRLSTLNDMK